MFIAKSMARRMRLEQVSANFLQALQRGFALRRVRATAIAEIHGKLWRAAQGLSNKHNVPGLAKLHLFCMFLAYGKTATGNWHVDVESRDSNVVTTAPDRYR